ncbi:MAG: metalloregulator ArsR/SmtB family transcription factor [Candidatus Magnetoovum sp. WYHC-5]|nr:metalloregulator ArsR/SmtB family transcription factor [Candidatus Magnetoovum sp. WYHC-5]
MHNKLILKIAYMLKILGHPTRITIIQILSEGQRCVCEIMALINEEQSTISKHLAVLKNAGLLESRKEGLSVFYNIKDKNISNIISIAEDILKNEILENMEILEK